jgi:hypothetical protein
VANELVAEQRSVLEAVNCSSGCSSITEVNGPARLPVNPIRRGTCGPGDSCEEQGTCSSFFFLEDDGIVMCKEALLILPDKEKYKSNGYSESINELFGWRCGRCDGTIPVPSRCPSLSRCRHCPCTTAENDNTGLLIASAASVVAHFVPRRTHPLGRWPYQRQWQWQPKARLLRRRHRQLSALDEAAIGAKMLDIFESFRDQRRTLKTAEEEGSQDSALLSLDFGCCRRR